MTRQLSLASGLTALVLAAPTGAGVAAYRQDAATRGVLPVGTTVGGVDVSRLTRDTAITVVRARLAATARPVVLRVGGREFAASLDDLGAEQRVAAAVDRAFAAARHGTWVTRAWHKLRRQAGAPAVPVEIVEPDDAALKRYVAGIARQVDVTARDAAMHVVDGFLRFDRAVVGRRLDRTAAVAALRAALRDGRPRNVALAAVPPAVPDSVHATTLLVRTGENKLYVYRNGVVERTYGVATGSPRYLTPTGTFTITLKRYRPTWVNPWSSWSMREPAFIRPGPRNPLGTRALNLSAPGIRIHGTPMPRSIGYSVSHGCIRMRMPDVEALYDLVTVGTTVVIVRAGPARAAPPSQPATPADVADGG